MPLQKIIISGNIIEIYRYKMLNIGKKTGKNAQKTHENDAENDKKRRIRERKNTIRRLICANFGAKDKFLTLTYAENKTDIQQCNRDFAKFIMRLKTKYSNLKYLAVPEQQKRGAWHYHMISNLPYIPVNELESIWGHGYIYINAIDTCDNVGAYVSKYVGKAVADCPLHSKAYLASRNLDKPAIAQSWRGNEISAACEIVQNVLNATVKPRYSNTYGDTDNEVTYMQYNLADIKNRAEICELIENSTWAIADELATINDLIERVKPDMRA